MIIRKLAQILCALTLFAACLLGQTVSSGLQGTVMDPANAVVPGATVTLTNSDTGTTRVTTTDSTGLFRFLDLPPDTYSVSVKATGFKGYTQNTIIIAANETRDAGKFTLTLGSGTETITVTAEAASIQLASSEKATAIVGEETVALGGIEPLHGTDDAICHLASCCKKRIAESGPGVGIKKTARRFSEAAFSCHCVPNPASYGNYRITRFFDCQAGNGSRA